MNLSNLRKLFCLLVIVSLGFFFSLFLWPDRPVTASDLPEPGWVKVKDLKVGDKLKTQAGWTEITSIEYVPEPITVYNLTVSEPNTFWANGILAHNKNGEGDERIVGSVIYCDDGGCNTTLSVPFNVVSQDAKTASWGVDGNNSTFEIGRWPTDTTVQLTITDADNYDYQCAYWTACNEPLAGGGCAEGHNFGGPLSGGNCTSGDFLIGSGSFSPDWQNHFQFYVIDIPLLPDCTSMTLNGASNSSGFLEFDEGETITIEADASDPDSNISQVDFYYFFPEGGDYCGSGWVKIGTDFSPADCGSKWCVSWNTSGLAVGDYMVAANAFDDEEPRSNCTGNPTDCGTSPKLCTDCRQKVRILSPPEPSCDCSIGGLTLNVGETKQSSFILNVNNGNDGDPVNVNFSDSAGCISVDPNSLSLTYSSGGGSSFSYLQILDIYGTIPCSSTTLTANINLAGSYCNSCSVNMTVNQPADSWFQTEGGDVHGESGISSTIPETAADLNFSRDGLGGYPGVVSYHSGTYNFNDQFCSDDGPTHWLASSGANSGEYSFDDLYETLTKNIDVWLEGDINSWFGRMQQATNDYFRFSGPQTITTAVEWNIRGRKIVVVGYGESGGDLTINESNFNVLENFQASVVFVVNGNITIGPKVTKLQGIYFANGSFITEADVDGEDDQLQFEGMIYAKDFSLGRVLADNTSPAEEFIYRPDLLINAAPVIFESKYTWQELSP